MFQPAIIIILSTVVWLVCNHIAEELKNWLCEFNFWNWQLTVYWYWCKYYNGQTKSIHVLWFIIFASVLFCFVWYYLWSIVICTKTKSYIYIGGFSPWNLSGLQRYIWVVLIDNDALIVVSAYTSAYVTGYMYDWVYMCIWMRVST